MSLLRLISDTVASGTLIAVDEADRLTSIVVETDSCSAERRHLRIMGLFLDMEHLHVEVKRSTFRRFNYSSILYCSEYEEKKMKDNYF